MYLRKSSTVSSDTLVGRLGGVAVCVCINARSVMAQPPVDSWNWVVNCFVISEGSWPYSFASMWPSFPGGHLMPFSLRRHFNLSSKATPKLKWLAVLRDSQTVWDGQPFDPPPMGPLCSGLAPRRCISLSTSQAVSENARASPTDTRYSDPFMAFLTPCSIGSKSCLNPRRRWP